MSPNDRSTTFSNGYRRYLLLLCSLAYFLAFMDRNLFAAVLTPIKKEFGLSDATLGMLSGLAFALTYSLLGVPIGAIADRVSRKWILVASITAWSVMTAMCGLTRSAFWLMLARLGVGAGEAGVTPASISVISEIYPGSNRVRAIGCYPIAGGIGAAAAYPVAGYLATAYGWRSVFLVLSVPGILLAAIFAVSFTDPRPARERRQAPAASGFGAAMKTIFTQPRLIFVFCATGVSSMLASILQWLPAFLVRSHHASLIQSGKLIGLVLLFTSPIAMLTGAWVADRIGPSGTRKVLGLLALSAVLQAGTGVMMFTASGMGSSVAWMVIWSLTLMTYVAPCFALSQSLVPVDMRATSMSIISVFSNLLGYGVGPIMIGAISQSLASSRGHESLRWSLVSVSCGLGAIGAALFLAGAKFDGKRNEQIPVDAIADSR